MSTQDGAARHGVRQDDGSLAIQLLDAAEAELDEHGVGELSLRAIARRVGVSHQAPGHHYGSRAGLLTAVAVRALTRYCDESSAALRAAAHAPARERLALLAGVYARAAERHPGLLVLTMRSDLLEMADPALRRERGRVWEGLVQAVAAAQAEGWRADEPTDLLALRCFATVHGTALLWSAGLVTLPVARTGLVALIAAVTDGL